MSEQTPEQAQAAVQQQVQGVAADLGPGPQAPAADLGQAMAASGASAGEVDTAALLQQIQALQRQMDAMQAEKRADLAPEVVKYAQAAADHISAKITANPHLAGEAGSILAAGSELAAKVGEAAQAEADGQAGATHGPVADLEKWVKEVAARHPGIDFGYVLQLAGEIAAAAARLAA